MIAPGLCLAVYGSIAKARKDLEAIRPDIVMLHTTPGPEDAPAVKAVRALGARLWFGVPANTLADDSDPGARVKRWCHAARDFGAELVMVNAERPSRPGWPGWVGKNAAERAFLADQAQRSLDGVDGIDVAFTSHDWPDAHPLNWDRWLGKRSPVKLHVPQVYPGTKRTEKRPTGTTMAGVRSRHASTVARWRKLVAAGTIRADLGPDGDGWGMYAQAWGTSIAGMAWLLDQSPIACQWSYPDDLWRDGVIAARAVAEIRRRVGHEPGAIARYQASVGLKPDRLCGPKTLAALGIA